MDSTCLLCDLNKPYCFGCYDFTAGNQNTLLGLERKVCTAPENRTLDASHLVLRIHHGDSYLLDALPVTSL